MFKNNKHLKDLLIHDVEIAAFIIVALTLGASITSFAFEDNNRVKLTYDPINVEIKDINNDGYNDMIITHKDGHTEISYSRN
jgi:hypothetical protein